MRLILWMAIVHYLDLPLLTSGIDPKTVWVIALWAAAFDLTYLWLYWRRQTEEMFDLEAE